MKNLETTRDPSSMKPNIDNKLFDSACNVGRYIYLICGTSIFEYVSKWHAFLKRLKTATIAETCFIIIIFFFFIF